MWSVLAEFVVLVSWKACRWEKIECPPPPTEGVRGQKIWTPSFSVSTTPEEPNIAKKINFSKQIPRELFFYDIAHHTIWSLQQIQLWKKEKPKSRMLMFFYVWARLSFSAKFILYTTDDNKYAWEVVKKDSALIKPIIGTFNVYVTVPVGLAFIATGSAIKTKEWTKDKKWITPMI